MTSHALGGQAGSRQQAASGPSGRYSRHLDVISKIRLRQSMHINLKYNPAKFHPNPI